VKIRRALAMSAIILLPAAAYAGGDMQNPDRLRGQMFIAGATLVDPPPDEPRRSHAYLEVTGDAARHLYETMPAHAVPDLCSPGRRFKQAGHLTCSVGARDARCAFAIDLRDGALAAGTVC
jgi:hypothetical protein